MAKFIADKVFVSQILDGPHALLANILEIVETLFKFTAAFCSAALASVFEPVLLDSRTRRPANQNSYRRTFPVFSSDIALFRAQPQSLYSPELRVRFGSATSARG